MQVWIALHMLFCLSKLGQPIKICHAVDYMPGLQGRSFDVKSDAKSAQLVSYYKSGEQHITLIGMACRDIVPLGQTKSSFNYSIDDKRVLNFENVVNDDDNVKQDMSIDVYGRAEKEDEEQAAAEPEKETEKVVPSAMVHERCTLASCVPNYFQSCDMIAPHFWSAQLLGCMRLPVEDCVI